MKIEAFPLEEIHATGLPRWLCDLCGCEGSLVCSWSKTTTTRLSTHLYKMLDRFPLFFLVIIHLPFKNIIKIEQTMPWEALQFPCPEVSHWDRRIHDSTLKFSGLGQSWGTGFWYPFGNVNDANPWLYEKKWQTQKISGQATESRSSKSSWTKHRDSKAHPYRWQKSTPQRLQQPTS